jgi:hypothetical protein
VSRTDGSLIDSKTLNPKTPPISEELVFADVPGDALVTAAYTLTRPQNFNGNPVSTKVFRLATYLASYANQRGFSISSSREFLADLFVNITRPNATTSFVSGVNLHFPFILRMPSDGSPINNIFDGIYTDDLQSDGKYSPLLFALDSNFVPLAYIAFPDRSLPTTSISNTLTVNAGDWKTDLQSFDLTVSNYTGIKFSNTNIGTWNGTVQAFGARKGSELRPIFNTNGTFSQGQATFTFPMKYANSFYDSFGYEVGVGIGDYTQAGQPRYYKRIVRRGANSLPASLTLDFNNDFLPAPALNVIADPNTAQPSFAWSFPGNLSIITRINYYIVNRFESGYDYSWTFNVLPPSTTSLKVPALPTALASFAPSEGAAGHKYTGYVQYVEDTPSLYRTSSAYRTFANDVGATSQNVGGLVENQRDEAKADPFAIELR